MTADKAFLTKRVLDLEHEIAHLRNLLDRAEDPCPVCGAPERASAGAGHSSMMADDSVDFWRNLSYDEKMLILASRRK